jgi:hypothetical protein
MKGGCACGRIQYTCTAIPDRMSNCYCLTCRKIGGGPFLTFASVPTISIRWLGTPPDTWKRSEVAERGFCSKCGSTLSMRYYCQIDRFSVTASSIEECKVPLPKLGEHLFVNERASWYEIQDDGVERFDGMPPGFDIKMQQWLEERPHAT